MNATRLTVAAIVAALSFLSACSGALRAKFPTEDEVRGKLQKGMTAEQVLATFGEPPGHHWVDVKLGGKVHYIAPVAARTKPGEGYAGFTVYFDRGKVWDWEVILLNPSYEHRLLARTSARPLAIVGLVVVGAAGYAVFRVVRDRREEEEALRATYRASEIPTADLPSDFRFITRGTTLQQVIEQAGPPSRTKAIELDGNALSVFEYELPARGAVVVMPELPFEPESRVRAVLYRRPRTGEI